MGVEEAAALASLLTRRSDPACLHAAQRVRQVAHGAGDAELQARLGIVKSLVRLLTSSVGTRSVTKLLKA